MEGGKKIDFSLVEDEKLRPWTKLEALDEAMDKELLKLSKTISNSPQKSAGLPGQSSLDVKNPELEAFRSFVSQPRWVDKIGELSSTTNVSNIKPASSGKGSTPSSPMKMGGLNVIEPNSTTTPIDNSACNTSLLSAIDELSKSNLNEQQMQLVQKIQQLQLQQQQQQQISTQQQLGSSQSTQKTRRPKTNHGGSRITRDMLKAVEYKPRKGPAVLNISTERYQAMMKYFAARAMPKSTSQPSLVTTAQQEDLLEALVQSEIEEALRQHSDEELASLEAFLQQQFQQEQEAQGKQGEPQETTTEEEGVATEDASNGSAQSLSSSSSSSSQTQNQPQTMPPLISPIKTLQSSASAPVLSAGRLNLSDELIRSTPGEMKKLVDPSERGPRDVVTASTLKTTPTKSNKNNNHHHVQISPVKSNFKSSQNQGTLTSTALSKLGVSPNTGTIANSFLCTRMKEIKTFRDQLLTGTGAYKPSDPRSKVSEEDMAKATQDMIKAVVERNRTDSTWTLLATPGYYESRGPDKIFVSETISVHKSTEGFEEHIRTMDKSRGLKRDDITEWVENAAKNKMKMFEPSGTIKM